MMLRTHITIVILAILLFVSHVKYQILFIIVALTATILPDIDCMYSTVGKSKIFRPLQFFIKHRSIIHSFTIAIILSFILAFLIPVIALPFFLGYSLHVFVDAFTKEGVMPFWPWKKTSFGFLKTGGRIESSIFMVFAVIDVIVFFIKVL